MFSRFIHASHASLLPFEDRAMFRAADVARVCSSVWIVSTFRLLTYDAIVNGGIQVFCVDPCFRFSGGFLLGGGGIAGHMVTLCVWPCEELLGCFPKWLYYSPLLPGLDGWFQFLHLLLVYLLPLSFRNKAAKTKTNPKKQKPKTLHVAFGCVFISFESLLQEWDCWILR